MSKIIKKNCKKSNINIFETYSLDKKYVYTNCLQTNLEPIIKPLDHIDSINTFNYSNPSQVFSLVRNHKINSKL